MVSGWSRISRRSRAICRAIWPSCCRRRSGSGLPVREANVRKFRWSRSRSSCTLKKGSSKNRRRRFRGRSPRATSTGGTPRGFEGDKIQGRRYNRHSQRSLREECRLGAACCDEQHVAPLGGEDIHTTDVPTSAFYAGTLHKASHIGYGAHGWRGRPLTAAQHQGCCCASRIAR
jgi:hypothetical protein